MRQLIPFILFISFWVYVDTIRNYIPELWIEITAFVFFIWMGLSLILHHSEVVITIGKPFA